MVDEGVVLERDVSEVVAPVWVAYWHRLGWEVDGDPVVVGTHAAGHHLLDYHLRAARPGAVVPAVRAAYDHRAVAA